MKVSKVDPLIVNVIEDSIESSNLITISYVDSQNKPSVRTVEPYEIKEGKLYAHCLTKNATRAFIVSRIQSVELLGQTFVPRY